MDNIIEIAKRKVAAEQWLAMLDAMQVASDPVERVAQEVEYAKALIEKRASSAVYDAYIDQQVSHG